MAPKTETPAEPKKEEGGWFGGLKSFGKNLVGGAIDTGKNLVNGAKEMGQGALNVAGDAWNGASKWMSDHKAEIAIGIGVVALAAATILTGGAALAVAGAASGLVAGTGIGMSGVALAGAVGTVAAGGFVAGAGLNLAQQGAQIKDGVVDPATGQKKTDINLGDVGKSGLTGAVMAPVAAATFGVAPVLVGGAAILGGGQAVKSGIENVQQGHNWSAALDFGTAAMAFAPMATKGGRNAMFGAEARAQTLHTANRAWVGAKNLPTRALNAADNLGYGAKVLAAELSPTMVTPEGLIGRPPMPETPTPRPLIPAPEKPQPMMMQGHNPEGPQGAGTQGKGTTQQTQSSEPKVPKGDRPAVPTAKENPKGVTIPGKAEAKANAIAVRKASKQTGYTPTEEDAFHIVADALNRGKLPGSHVTSATFDPKTGKWILGENGTVPKDLSTPLEGWVQKTQNKVDAGKIPEQDWPVANCAEPNALNNAASIKSPSLDGKVVYTFEARKLRIDPGSPKELRLFYKKPCPYCETLSNEGVEMPQHRKWLERNGSEE